MQAPGGLGGVNNQALLKEIEKIEVRDMMRLYNSIAGMCFNRCTKSFLSKDLTAGDEKCLDACVEKYMNSMKRCGMRFAEEQYLEQQRKLQQGGQVAGSQ